MYTDSSMYQPIPIKATLLEPGNLQRVQQIITEQDSATRWAISREVCEQFDFLDAKGQVRGHSCLAALTQLERQGRISLPPNGILFKEIHTFTNFIEWQLIDSRDINIYFKKSIKNLLTNACAFPIILCIALCSLGQ